MESYKKPFLVKAIALLICVVIIFAQFDPWIIESILPFATANSGWDYFYQGCIISFDPYSRVSNRDKGIAVILIFILCFIFIYALYRIFKLTNKK